jgi:hypothetical protein
MGVKSIGPAAACAAMPGRRAILKSALAQKRATIEGQYPAAAILSCVDSRAPAEIILDDEVAKTNVRRTVETIRQQSGVLAEPSSC